MGNPRRYETPVPMHAKQKNSCERISLEIRKVGMGDGSFADSRVMDFESVFLVSSDKVEGGNASAPSTSTGVSQQGGVNVGELLVVCGYGTVIRHRDFEERSNYYNSPLSAESRAIAGRKGIHSSKDPAAMHMADLTTASTKKAKDFLPHLQRKRMPAVVEYVLSDRRFKLCIPKETCSIAFSLSGVGCPGRYEPFSNEAIAFMRRKILQRDVEIEVETVNWNFLGFFVEVKD